MCRLRYFLLVVLILVGIFALAVVAVSAAPPKSGALRKCHGTFWRKGCYQYDPVTGKKDIWVRSLYRGQWVRLAEAKQVNGLWLVRRSYTKEWYNFRHFRSK